MARSPAFKPRPPFDRQRPLVVRRTFDHGGRVMAPGEAFDASGVNDRRLRLLYDSGYLQHGTATPSAPATTNPPVDDRPVIRHRGGGRWYIMRADQVIAGPFDREAAEAALAAAA
ncbi:MAG: hypothetical protein ACK53W_12695 [Gemmatimonadota bacterium]